MIRNGAHPAEAGSIPWAGAAFTGATAEGKAGQAAGDGRIRERMKRIGEAVAEAGGSLESLDPALFSDPVGMMALGGFLDGYMSTREGLLKAKEAHARVAERQFRILTNGFRYLEQNRQNPQALAVGIERLSGCLNLPYNVRFNPERKAFDVFYQDRTGEKPTGRSMAAGEVMAALQDLVRHPETFHRLYARNALAIMSANNAYRRDPGLWLYARNEDGREVTLVPQKQPRPEGGIEVGYTLLEKGKAARFVTLGELATDCGITPRAWEEHWSREPGQGASGVGPGAEDGVRDAGRPRPQGGGAFRPEAWPRP